MKKIIQTKEIRAVTHNNTVLKQLIAFLPRYEFDTLAKVHHAGQKFRSYNRWSQFLALLIGQLSSRKSLRDITDNLKAQGKQLYHLGMKKTCKATLARVNAEQPASLYQMLFAKLLSRCQLAAPKHKFSGSSAESVGSLGRWQVTKPMI